jgi:hypothetical protein
VMPGNRGEWYMGEWQFCRNSDHRTEMLFIRTGATVLDI